MNTNAIRPPSWCPRCIPATLPRRAVIAALLALLAGGLAAAAAEAQDLLVDRWLVTSGGTSAGYPLADRGPDAFPDRDVTVGPGYWSLVREDGSARIDLGPHAEAGAPTLAHAYLRSSRDVSVRLTLHTEACAGTGLWLNGQELVSPRAPIRLGAGWNTLLVRLETPPPCRATLGATVSPTVPLRDTRAREAGPPGLQVQASRPPGIRRTYPEGIVLVGAPEVRRLAWRPGRDDLVADVGFTLTAWGRPAGEPQGGGDAGRPAEPPAVDLSGEWDLTIYGPVGIRRVRAALEMEEDGELDGRLRGNEDEEGRRGEGPTFEGSLRDGWVSGDRFAWTLRLSGPGRSADVSFRGSLAAGRLEGTIAFGRDGRPGGLESRFEGRRVGDEAPEDETPGDEAREDERAERRPGPTGGAFGPSDPDGLRQRMIQQLLPAVSPGAAAPSSGSARLDVGGEQLVAAATDLVPARPYTAAGGVPFRDLREAALDASGLEAEIRWPDGERKAEGSLPPEAVLRAFHGPIHIAGLDAGEDGRRTAELRIPDALGGFTLRTGEGRWWVDGVEVSDGNLCAPCQRGRRLEIGYLGGAETPTVRIVERGFPEVGDEPGAPAAVEWLRALSGDNRRYRELAGG